MREPEPPMDAAYRVIAKSLRQPRVQNVTVDVLSDLLLSAKIERAFLDQAIAHAEKLIERHRPSE